MSLPARTTSGSPAGIRFGPRTRIVATSRTLIALALALSLSPLTALPAARSGGADLDLSVDAREVTHGLLHARLSLTVEPGPLTLYYPKWIPGEHAPSGPIQQLAGLRLTARARTLPWER